MIKMINKNKNRKVNNNKIKKQHKYNIKIIYKIIKYCNKVKPVIILTKSNKKKERLVVKDFFLIVNKRSNKLKILQIKHIYYSNNKYKKTNHNNYKNKKIK